MLVGTGEIPTWQESTYRYTSVRTASDSGTVGSSYGSSNTYFVLGVALGNLETERCVFDITITEPHSSTYPAFINYDIGWMDISSNIVSSKGHGFWNNTTAITGLRFYMGSGNITSGTFKLFGLKL
jgi:hypothetical protein